ncbi:hypothetical protein IPO96_02780 [Candidatus Saccharibacteria bacterium]|jgi:hypothetical protein|nr:MAG: hypothetical protein IPO96_02780 [Candidatus Saccharibacteria bacterium]
MSGHKKRINFYESEEGIEAKKLLEAMAENVSYNTESSFSANTNLYPDHEMSFVAKHMAYLQLHPGTDPKQYISNLRLMTKKR